MARGWESKSVEAQMESANNSSSKPVQKKNKAEKNENHMKRSALLLQRKRVQRDLDAAQNPRYQEILRKALAHLDGELEKLPSDNG